ncbi:MAG TPA: BREX system P-loop protein BrxC, partial [Thermomicrobiales bacterium]|nr:BREX system P-loop protein BrxC [Thermomicrobiales bacterium]
MPDALRNIDVLSKDPRAPIPNQGVAKVGRPATPGEWDVLRFELQTFVCEGEYARGLDRILNAYLGNAGKADQAGVWVSGFYGSGKSHFVRVLDALWSDIEFPDGALARDLTPSLSMDIKAALIELSAHGRRTGGLWSAAGVVSSGATSFRLAVLSILFAAAGLPAGYGPAKFMLWLKRQGKEDAVRRELAVLGTTLEAELYDMYVSGELGQAVLAAIPGFAATPAGVIESIQAQFPGRDDITDDELIAATRELLAIRSTDPTERGERPLPATLLVLDEVQQYIGENSSRALDVQTVVERFQKSLAGQMLVVATGQAALQDTANLQKLQGRFTVPVQLRTADVEEVVRRVVLAKKPDGIAPVRAELERISGEIDRHLAGTRIGARPDDRDDLVNDYPLLPVRRRFWDDLLRNVDKTGQGGQLRSQLQVTQEAVRLVADKPLGWVIPADAIYDRLSTTLVQTGVLLTEIEERIAREREGAGADAALRGRTLATIFLIEQLSTGGVAATGVRATPDAIADLLVEDLPRGSATLRDDVARVLTDLTDAGYLMQVEGQYRLQTREGQEWDQEFRHRLTGIRNDDARVAYDRADALRRALQERLKGIALLQGKTKVKREFTYHFGTEPPEAAEGAVPLWVRDEWTATETTVRADARTAGTDSPVVSIFLPKREPEALRAALAGAAAARETIELRPTPMTDEGKQARSAMESRLDAEQRKVAALAGQIVDAARVLQGGGIDVPGAPAEAVRDALEASLARRF